MNAPDSRCCLCLDELTTSKGKTRQKKFFSDACSEERKKLQSIARVNCHSLIISKFNRDSILCYTCLLKLGKLVKYEKEINQIESDLSELLLKLNRTSSDVCKRLSSDAALSSPEPKRSKCATSATNISPAVSVSS